MLIVVGPAERRIILGFSLAALPAGACALERNSVQGGTASSSIASSSSSSTGQGGQGGSSAPSTSSTGEGGNGGVAPCGNGKIDPGEQCDDGNLINGDGCDLLCNAEPADDCPGSKVVVGPQGTELSGDTSSMHDNKKEAYCAADGDGGRDVVYAVTPLVGGTLVAKLTAGFKGSISARRQCTISGRFGELDCDPKVIKLWVQRGETYFLIVDGENDMEMGSYSVRLDLYPCGNGQVEELEECDNPMDPTCIGCIKCDQTRFEDPNRHHCYKVESSLTWPDAKLTCVHEGGDLVTIGNFAEWQLVNSHQGNNDVWIGASDLFNEGTFRWSSAEPFYYVLWDNGQPDNQKNSEDCVEMYKIGGKYNDADCGGKRDFICERTPVGRCGDGIVQRPEQCDDGNDIDADGCSHCIVDCGGPGEFKDPATHHCYRYVSTPAIWADAAKDCAAWHGSLASIQSQAENDYLAPLLPDDAWFGATDPLGIFVWVFQDAEPMIYTNWRPGEPNNFGSEKCVEIYAGEGTWNNDGCNAQHPYLCERVPAGAD